MALGRSASRAANLDLAGHCQGEATWLGITRSSVQRVAAGFGVIQFSQTEARFGLYEEI